MRNTRNSKNNNGSASLKIFTTWSDDVLSGGRLDAKYWLPAIRELQKAIQNGKYKSQKLGDFITAIRYGLSTANDYVDFGIPFLRILNLKNDGIDVSNVVYLSEDQKDEIGKAVVHEGDLLISRSGSVGIVVVVPKEAENFAFGSFMIKFCLNEKINKQFIAAWLNSEASRKLIEREKIGAIQGNITIETIKNFDIPIPPLSVQNEVVKKIQEAYEQKKKKETEILKILSSIDDFVLGELGIDMPRERAERVFQIWSDEIEGRIDPFFYKPYFKTLQRAIESKNYSELGELVEFAKETWDQKSVFDNQFPYIEISNIDTSNGEIAKTDFVPVAEAPSRAKMVVREGDIIVSTTRPNRGAITPILKEQDGFIASTGFAILRDLKNSKVLKDYLFVALRTSLSLRQMEQRTTGGNYPAITTEDLRKIKIVVPDMKIQGEIVDGVKTIYEKAKRLRQEAEDVVAETQKQVEQMILA